MRRVVSVLSVRLMELMTLTHIGVMYYLNASPSTLWLPSINYLITTTGNAGPTKFKTIRQKKSRLRPSIPPPKSTATVPTKSSDEPIKKKDPPTATVPTKSADEPIKKKDPPPPPESEK
eukprot:scaffold257575_cov50-Attheya_sp.AAC.1